MLTVARRELILGGQKSGKSRRGEQLATAWMASPALGGAPRRAVLIATAQAHDGEMRQRIARHRADRAARAPGLQTVEEPLDLAQALRDHSAPETLVLVDCLTLWLTHLMMPFDFEPNETLTPVYRAQVAAFLIALQEAPGPVVLVGNEIGMGVIPLGREVRAFVDALGVLNQQVAASCERVTLMVAGLPLTVKEEHQ